MRVVYTSYMVWAADIIDAKYGPAAAFYCLRERSKITFVARCADDRLLLLQLLQLVVVCHQHNSSSG